MKNNVTELVFILDRSGSMAGLEKDTIGGFNSMLDKQEGDAYVTTVLFDNEAETLHDRLPLKSVPHVTEKEYYVRGCTALLDAIGGTVEHISDIHRYARPEDVPARTMVVITTDGMENASRRYRYDDIKRMVERKKEEGWEFLFIGANIDAIGAAGSIGIDGDRAVNYRADGKGTRAVFRAVSAAVGSVCKSCQLSKEWSQEIEKDYNEQR